MENRRLMKICMISETFQLSWAEKYNTSRPSILNTNQATLYEASLLIGFLQSAVNAFERHIKFSRQHSNFIQGPCSTTKKNITKKIHIIQRGLLLHCTATFLAFLIEKWLFSVRQKESKKVRNQLICSGQR